MTIPAQNTQILAALKRGERITALDALMRFECLRLAGRVHELRADGYAIETEIIDVNGKRIARYRLARQKRAAA